MCALVLPSLSGRARPKTVRGPVPAPVDKPTAAREGCMSPMPQRPASAPLDGCGRADGSAGRTGQPRSRPPGRNRGFAPHHLTRNEGPTVRELPSRDRPLLSHRDVRDRIRHPGYLTTACGQDQTCQAHEQGSTHGPPRSRLWLLHIRRFRPVAQATASTRPCRKNPKTVALSIDRTPHRHRANHHTLPRCPNAATAASYVTPKVHAKADGHCAGSLT